MIAVQKLERRLPHGVVAAWQNRDLMVHSMVPYPPHRLLRKLQPKGGVVSGVDELRFLPFLPRELAHVVGRTDRHPNVAQSVEVDMALDTLFDMLRRKPGPHDVRHIG